MASQHQPSNDICIEMTDYHRQEVIEPEINVLNGTDAEDERVRRHDDDECSEEEELNDEENENRKMLLSQRAQQRNDEEVILDIEEEKSEVESQDESLEDGEYYIRFLYVEDTDSDKQTNSTSYTSNKRASSQNKEKACLICVKPVKLSTFLNESLVPGDHIKVRGRIPGLGRLYYHHAIIKEVNNISSDGLTANITVIDVNQKRKGPYRMPNCMQFETHPLEINGKASVRCDRIERVDYSKHFNDQATTLEIAETALIEESYCFLSNNCENVVTACKLAEINTGRKLKLLKSLSIQSFRLVKKIYVFISIFFRLGGL